MPKDTKSSGYNKAPACESRGFGHKKEGENFDTPSFLYARREPLSGIPFDTGCPAPSTFLKTVQMG